MDINPKGLTLNQLLGSSTEQYVIPPYQRRYSWTWRQCADLWEDIEILDDGDHHLLGSIVCLVAPHGAGLNRLELVDGQQRLTSISILLHVIREKLKAEGEAGLSIELDGLLSAKALGELAEPKIALDSLDQGDYLKIISGEVTEENGNPRLHEAYGYFKGWVDDLALKDLGIFLHRLRHQTTVIRLEVSQAKDAFKLFETINNRGLSLSSTDIIKNFLLGNAARFDDNSLQKAKTMWSQLVIALDGLRPDVFFRHYLCAITKSRVTRAKVVASFKEHFFSIVIEAEKLKERDYFGYGVIDLEENDEDDEEVIDGTSARKPKSTKRTAREQFDQCSFADFIANLLKYAQTYRHLIKGETGNPKIDHHLRNLLLIKAAPAYMFLMARQMGNGDEKSMLILLPHVETFLLRRQVCKSRTNETEQVFATLCKNGNDPDLTAIIEHLAEYTPPDGRFEKDFALSTFTQANIGRARYCLESFERDRQGSFQELKVLGSESVQVEHIIPQKILTARSRKQFGDWVSYLGKDAAENHRIQVAQIGNLTLFAGELNLKASNNPYKSKCEEYTKSSLKITSSLPEEFPFFRFEQVTARSEDFAKLAVKIWPIPSA